MLNLDEINTIIHALIASANDAYSASLPLIAAAGLGNKEQYDAALNIALKDLNSQHGEASFNAWMWGRVLLAAKDMGDAKSVALAKAVLFASFNEKNTTKPNIVFLTWAAGYHAAFNEETYQIFKNSMMNSAQYLANSHPVLSDVLWAWVMNLCASATAQDRENVGLIKQRIATSSSTEPQSVANVLQQGLKRTAQSNDYPAWALAKVRHAAALIQDHELYDEVGDMLSASFMNEANTPTSKAEYVLAVIENDLALKVYEAAHQPATTRTS